MQEWSKGLLTLTHDVQQKLGDDKLLIGKVPDQPYVKAVQIESFSPNNRSINSLMEGVKNGKVIQAHMDLTARWWLHGKITKSSCFSDWCIGNYSYYGCGRKLCFITGMSWYWFSLTIRLVSQLVHHCTMEKHVKTKQLSLTAMAVASVPHIFMVVFSVFIAWTARPGTSKIRPCSDLKFT